MGSENTEKGLGGHSGNSYDYCGHHQPSPVGVPHTLTSEAPQPHKVHPLMVPILQVRQLKLREAE